MQTSLATLLIISASVIFVSVLVGYSVAIVQQTLSGESIPQLDRLTSFENHLLNQTDSLFNLTQPVLPGQSPLP